MDLKKVFLEIFDKVAIGLAAALLALYLALAFLAESPAEKAKEDVRRYNAAIAELKRAAEANPPKPEPLAYAKDVESALRGGPPPERMPEWLFHKRPLIVYRVRTETAEEPLHLPPTNVRADSKLGSIAVSWQWDERSKYVEPVAFKVYRAEGAPKDWKEVASLDGKAHSWIDKGVRSRVAYYYTVESAAQLDRNHPMVKKGKVAEFPEDQRVQKSEVVGPVQTKRDTYIEVLGATLRSTPQEIAAGDDHPASAYLKVWRFIEAEGMWMGSAPTSYKAGDKIGAEEGFGTKKRDFRTSYVLDGVVKKEIRQSLAGQERTVKVNVVVLKDANTGETLELTQEQPDPELSRVKARPKEAEEDEEPPGDKGGKGKDKGK